MILDGLTMLIANADLTSRSRLREVIKNCVYKAELNLVQSCKEVAQHLELNDKVEVVLLSFNFGDEALKAIIQDTKNRMGIAAPIFIVTIEKQSSDTSAKVTSLYLDGASGFIAEPYSPSEFTTLLEMVKVQREKVDSVLKQRKATRFLLAEAIKRVDDIAKQLLLPKPNTGMTMKELRNISESISTLYAQDPQGYADIAIDVFEKVPAPIGPGSLRRGRTKKKAVSHPGKIIMDIMGQRDLTFERLVPSIKVDLKEFQMFLDCQRGIDDDFSRELARLFGRTPSEWLKLQKEYDFYFETTQASQSQSG